MPGEVEDLAMMACRNVEQLYGVEPDFTPETLPLLDQYLRELPPDSKPEVVELVLSTVGCYFGEVARRLLNGRWAMVGDSPAAWRVELISCFFHFRPVGMAGEILTSGASDAHDGSIATLDGLQDGLSRTLSEAAPLPEEEYYSLAGRVDVLELATDWLTSRQLASDEGARRYTAEDYQMVLEGL